MWAIIDCNSFYCSCERVFRPELARKPVVVLSNNDGCIIARSDEAKALGVEMTGPYFLAKDIIEKNNVAVFSSNYNLYGDLSRRVMDAIKEVVGDASNVEVYSVDEAFVHLHSGLLNDLSTLAARIKDTVELWTGVNVSVGIAPTKTLAKLANRLAKKDKIRTGCQYILSDEAGIMQALQATAVKHLWGVGRQFAEKLTGLGIHTAWQLRNLPEEWVRKNMGGVVGVRMLKELQGQPCIFLEPERTTKKMIATTRMFGKPVTELQDIKEAVATYASRAAEKLRRQHSAAGVLSVYVVAREKGPHGEYTHGASLSAYYIFAYPTSLTNDLIKAATALAEKLFQRGKGYKKAGVILSSLVPDDAVQGHLFEEQKSMGRFLMDMIDNINFGMRGDVVKFAAAGTKRNWKMRQEFSSPRYTTRWMELCLVK